MKDAPEKKTVLCSLSLFTALNERRKSMVPCYFAIAHINDTFRLTAVTTNLYPEPLPLDVPIYDRDVAFMKFTFVLEEPHESTCHRAY